MLRILLLLQLQLLLFLLLRPLLLLQLRLQRGPAEPRSTQVTSPVPPTTFSTDRVAPRSLQRDSSIEFVNRFWILKTVHVRDFSVAFHSSEPTRAQQWRSRCQHTPVDSRRILEQTAMKKSIAVLACHTPVDSSILYYFWLRLCIFWLFKIA